MELKRPDSVTSDCKLKQKRSVNFIHHNKMIAWTRNSRSPSPERPVSFLDKKLEPVKHLKNLSVSQSNFRNKHQTKSNVSSALLPPRDSSRSSESGDMPSLIEKKKNTLFCLFGKVKISLKFYCL